MLKESATKTVFLEDMNNIKTVIVFMMDKHMGNFVVSIPAIQMLRDFFKEKTFNLVIDEFYKIGGAHV